MATKCWAIGGTLLGGRDINEKSIFRDGIRMASFNGNMNHEWASADLEKLAQIARWLNELEASYGD